MARHELPRLVIHASKAKNDEARHWSLRSRIGAQGRVRRGWTPAARKPALFYVVGALVGLMRQRQKKIDLTRILLQLPDGTRRRICSLGNPKDKLEDPYLKLVFPDLHGKPLQRTLQKNDRWVGGNR